MSRLLSFIVFFGIMAGLTAVLHWYLWARLVRDPGFSGLAQAGLTWLIVGLGLSLPMGMLLFRVLPRELSQAMAWMVFVWMGVAFFLVLLILSVDLLRMLGSGFNAIATWAAGEGAGVDVLESPGRRQLVAQTVAGAASATAFGLTAVSVRSATSDIQVREVGVKLARLPPVLSGLTITQLSDVHVGPTIGRRFIQHVVEKTNASKPDVIVITGDLVDGTVEELRQHVAPLAGLKAKQGIYFITGNHEYYSGVDPWIEELRRMGITVLRNERVTLGDDSGSIDLAGVDDFTAHRFGNGHGADLKKALEGRDQDRECVLLAHQPREIDRAAELGVGLQLSGHTHGGQIWPFNNVVQLVQPYVSGLHAHTEQTQIYVSRGTGYWGPPMRFRAPAEITKIILAPA